MEDVEEGEEVEATLSEVRRRMRGPEAKKPFHSCIAQLEKLNKESHTPLEKLQCIAQISQNVKKEIQEFWKGVKVE